MIRAGRPATAVPGSDTTSISVAFCATGAQVSPVTWTIVEK